jgi:hypothetical protein
MAVLASAAKQGQVHSAAMPDQETNTTQQPVVIRQGGQGLGTVIAAVILAAAAVYTINVWSTTKKETSPAKNLEQGIERIKDAAGKAIESRN